MRATGRCLIGAFVALAAAAIGMSGAPPIAADTSDCQQVGSTTTCGQGQARVSGTAGDNAGIQGHYGVMAPFGEGCINLYSTYQNCAVQEQGLFGLFRSAR